MKKWYQGDVLANGIRVHYYRTGGDGPPVVLCHGFTDNALCWAPLARVLEAEYDVIMIDARYHGLSEAPRETPDRAADMAADLIGVIDALHLDRPVAAGHSMGASTVFLAAADYPGRFRAIALEDPVWRDVASQNSDSEREARRQEWVRAERARYAAYRTTSLDELAADCQVRKPDWDASFCRIMMEAKQQLNPNVFGGSIIDQRPWREVLAAIDCPILLVTGNPEKGAIVTDAVYADAAAIKPALKRVHVPEVGHTIRFDAPGAYAAAIQAYLGAVYSST